MPTRVKSGLNFDSDQILCLLLEYIDDFETLYCMALLSQDLNVSLISALPSNQVSSFSLGFEGPRNDVEIHGNPFMSFVISKVRKVHILTSDSRYVCLSVTLLYVVLVIPSC